MANHQWLSNLARYGLGGDDYQAILDAQGGVCAICGSLPRDGRRLAIDHEHETGSVRGLLCSTCNRVLGMFGDDTARLSAAISYLADPPAPHVLQGRRPDRHGAVQHRATPTEGTA